MFSSIENSVIDYTDAAFDKFDNEDVTGLLGNRLIKARERLEETREAVKSLCEYVDLPRDTAAYLRYFCAQDTSDKYALKNNESKRVALYKQTAAFSKAYTNLANEMIEAGYSPEEIEIIKQEVKCYKNVYTEVKMASGDYIDIKMYEPAMRHLIDSYIHAEESQKISAFNDLNLIQLIVKYGENACKYLPKSIQENETTRSEVIENNIRKVIIDKQPVNPKYYEKMSDLLDTLIKERKEQAIQYKDYLKRIVELSKNIYKPEVNSSYSKLLDTPAKIALYDNLGQDEKLALEMDKVIRQTKKDGWRGNVLKEREIKNAINSILNNPSNTVDIEQIFELVKNQSEY